MVRWIRVAVRPIARLADDLMALNNDHTNRVFVECSARNRLLNSDFHEFFSWNVVVHRSNTYLKTNQTKYVYRLQGSRLQGIRTSLQPVRRRTLTSDRGNWSRESLPDLRA